MEIGSVLELDAWERYAVSEQKRPFWLPFMKSDTYQTVFYQSGRNAIEALLLHLKKKKNIQRMLLPDYMCETVKEAGKRAGVTMDFYKLDRAYGFHPEEVEEKLTENTCLFVAHFFGRKPEKKLLDYMRTQKEKGVIIIEDVTLSLFSSDEEQGVGFGTYTLGSIRKWLPVPDGGFVASCTEELPEKITDTCVSKYTDFYLMVQTMKREYIQGGCRDQALKDIYMSYYALSIRELFSDYRLYPMSEWSRNYLQNCDMESIVKKRMENYDYLYGKLSGLEGIEIAVQRSKGYLPFGMVILTKERDALLQYLIRNNIYCNVHWRLEASKENPELTFLSQHTITIPCDQRYGFAEMDVIADALEGWVRR